MTLNTKFVKKYIYEEALSKWGFIKQLQKLIEESAELTQSIIKLIHNGKINSKNFYEPELQNFIEEFADVEIMMEQIVVWEGDTFRRKVDQMKEKKLEALQERLKNDKVQNTDPESR